MFKGLLILLSFLFFTQNFFAKENELKLPAGTPVFIELIKPTSSKEHVRWDTIWCKVKYDVKVDDQTVIFAGSDALCRVSDVKTRKGWGRPGIIRLEPLSVTAVDGQKINLSGDFQPVVGKSKKKLAWTVGGTSCLVLWGVGLLAGFFVKGEEAFILSGTSYETKTVNEYVIKVKGLPSNTAVVQNNNDNLMRGGSDPFKGTNVANANKDIRVGKYYALIIGIDNYSGSWPPLKNAVRDAKSFESILRLDYKVDVFRTLYNSQATRANIISELEWLVNNVKEDDNVLIFYSGHGEFKKELNKGFWVPADAVSNSVSQFISNNDLQTFITAINSKHTLLISDACFSGDIFRGNTITIPYENTEKYYFNVYNAKSRQAISSGGIEPVMDGGKDGHSVFAYYLLQALQTNNAKYFDASQLFNKIKIPVVNNSEQSPNFNPIKNSGDEGGQFLFIKK